MFKKPFFFSLGIAAALVAGGASHADAQTLDELNGLWTVSLNGKAAGGAQTESYDELGGVRLRFQGKVLTLTHTGNTLTLGNSTTNTPGVVGAIDDKHNKPSNDATQVNLTVKGLDTPNPADDTLEGTYFGQKVVFTRDVSIKPPINIKLPGDRPWVRFMREILIPKTAEDRDSYHKFDKTAGGAWLKGTQLGGSGYWITKGWIKDQAGFAADISGMDGVLNTPRSILHTKFSSLIQANMRADKKSEAALALSSLSLYFSTASGGAVRIHVTDNDDSMIYYITDRRANNRTGLVVMKTPLHKPLASSFGKWQNDAGNMVLADDEPYIRAVLEVMAKSSTASMNKVSPTGRSGFTDYLGIMAIEDQRGVMFNQDDLDWGRNMTQASFDIMIIRALSHGQMRQKPSYDKKAGKVVLTNEQELASQVIDNGELKPGTPSYIDTLNGAEDALTGGTKGGNDCQVYGLSDMETLTTKWLRAQHADVIGRLDKALAAFGGDATNESIFSNMCDVFYSNDKFAKVTPAQATEIVESAMAMFATIKSDSKNLEAFYLANGIKKSADWAPRASGF